MQHTCIPTKIISYKSLVSETTSQQCPRYSPTTLPSHPFIHSLPISAVRSFIQQQRPSSPKASGRTRSYPFLHLRGCACLIKTKNTSPRCLRLRPSLPCFSPPLLGRRRSLSPGASAVPGPACDCVDESRRLLFLPPTDTRVGAMAGLAGAGGCVGRRASPAAVRADQDPHP